MSVPMVRVQRASSPIPMKAGIGLRFRHHQAVLETRPAVAWFEVHTENYMAGGRYMADLLPLPMTEEALNIVCQHVDEVQACLRRRILVENPSTYLRFSHSTI